MKRKHLTILIARRRIVIQGNGNQRIICLVNVIFVVGLREQKRMARLRLPAQGGAVNLPEDDQSRIGALFHNGLGHNQLLGNT
ncbi:MAG: hypothetical protein HDR75_03105 [Bacteroides sp.]|nr:hypothetical protein [Bacteroides sp.]